MSTLRNKSDVMTGELVISIEIELGWNRGKLSSISDGRTVETEILRKLLTLCDRRDIPISFDLVGHLFHDSCSGFHKGPHKSEWFDLDPGTSIDSDPEFYAPDIVRLIDQSDTQHEICTHSYSHAALGEIPRETLDWELERVASVHERAGLDRPVSLVPPWHSTPPLDALPDHGVETVRVPTQNEEPGSVGPFRFHPTLSPPKRQTGVTTTACVTQPSLTAPFMAQGQTSPHPVYDRVPVALRRWLHRRYLRSGVDTAIDSGGHVHYWTHLFNMANDEQYPAIDSFLEYAADRRDTGDLQIRRMCDLT